MLDRQSKGVPIDEQTNDDVVHLDRFRETDRLRTKRLIRVRSVRCLRSIYRGVPFARTMHVGVQMAFVPPQ